MTPKCINCRKEIEWARLQVLVSTSLCSKCAHKYKEEGLTYAGTSGRRSHGLTGTNFLMPIEMQVKTKKVPNSQMVFSVMREDALPRVSTPFKRVRKPTLGVIRNGALWTTLIPINRSVNRVVDDNGACSNDFSDSSCEFDTSVPRSANRNPGD